MTIYDPAPGPSRTSRITLPPMMMVPQTHHRPLNYNHDISQSSYLRHPYIAQAEYDYDYEFPANMSYRPDNDFQLPQDTSHAVEMQSTQINHDGSGPLSLSLLVAAAHAAQADISYANSPIHFTSSLPLSCELSTSGNYSPAVTSPDAQGNWPPVGLATSESDRLAPSPPQTPLATPDVMYDPSMMACCRSHSDGPTPHEGKWDMDRISAEPSYIHKPPFPPLSHIDYSNQTLVTHHHQHIHPADYPVQQPLQITTSPLDRAGSSDLTSRPIIKRTCKRRRIVAKSEEATDFAEASPDSQNSPRGEKPKQGRKKRSVGYVRPIIIHRKRVGQRLLDMLKSAPTPSKASSMEINRARCFPFADMKNKLRECTRRMRLDELDRLDKTLDGGEVRLKLSEEVLAEEPHRAGEFSVPSAGHTEEQSN
ncbi:hypothetical protein PtA15_6A33 [Puccinia triticina]|uniref:BHLH domain-containing protein n=1 Tax=Puccinia triticina TaxID=208348 RepID=A0ABY7CK00_9BASI|nr:uncharacterized protein PtA15_6A33 [Puccinia triticina]WAQ85405.1 hypothetical protein PtA15_6A33 [Puccinia triticina]